MVRLVALLIALSTGISGILPLGDGYRCLFTQKRMAPSAACCAQEAATTTTIGRACCEWVHGATPETRATHTVEEPRLYPAPLVAILPPAAVGVGSFGSTRAPAAAAPRGRPPGEQLREHSQILRI